MQIKLHGAANSYDGYGEITENLALALDRLGHNVWVNPVQIWYDKDSLSKRTFELTRNSFNQVDFEFLIMYPTYKFGAINKNSAIMTMFEAHKCPDVWTKTLNSMKIPIFAPSKFAAEMFKNSGVKVPVEVLHLGVDSEFYASKKREFPKDRPFRFLTMGKLEPRKNVEAALRSFQNAFTDENVEFVIKTREKFLSQEVKDMIRKDKRIKVIDKTVAKNNLRDLFYYCDAFIYFSRGEAFSFPPRNALATGMPIVVTDWSALAEIPGAIKIPITGLEPMPPCGFSYGQEKDLHMAVVDEQVAAKEMYRLATKETYYNKKIRVAAKIKQASWEDCAKDFLKLVVKYS